MKIAALLLAAGVAVLAQAPQPARSPSPDGMASIQVGWRADDAPAARVASAKWVDVLYGRPIRRARTELFGTGANYGVALKSGAPVWRAGANVLTRLRTEIPLVFGAKTVPAGEYCLFIDIKDAQTWTLIVSSQTTPAPPEVAERQALWNAFVYQPEKDVVRVPMKVEALPYAVDELTYVFTDGTRTSATLRFMWDTVMASVPFTIDGK
jgi:hypothetical protein